MNVLSLLLALAGCTRPVPEACVTDKDQFDQEVAPLLESTCITCHVADGIAGSTRNVLVSSDADANRESLLPLALEQVDGRSVLLLKILGELGHGGGPVYDEGAPEFAAFEAFVARAHQPGGCEDPTSIETCLPGELAPGTTPIRRLTSVQYANSVEDLVGVRPADGVFPPTERGPHYSTWAEANLVSSAGIEGIMLAAEASASAAADDIEGLTGCVPLTDACARTWAEDFTYRAFRRPLDGDENAILDTLWTAGVDPSERVSLVIEYALQTPQFLYLDGEGSTVEGFDGIERLTPHAVAARLSYFLLDTTPPQWVLDAAVAGDLNSREGVVAIARQLVEDPRAVPMVATFHQDWLHTYQLDTIAKDETVYPEFGPALVDDMKRELELFTTEVVWLGDGTFDALLYSPVSWTTPELDAIYGTSADRVGQSWERRVLDDSRPGVLTRSAFLTAHAYSATSSPIRRGTFVLEQMICEDLTPPPGVSLELEDPTETNTIRDRLAGHASDPVCNACHVKIDPVGFSFEHYGALGEWRDDWANGIPVDASGTLLEPPGSFVGVPEMLSVIDSGSRVRDCYTRQWFQYGTGRPAELVDQCELAAIGDRFEFTGGDLRDLVVQIAASESIRFRETRVLENPQ